MFISDIVKLFNKFIGSRKAALHDNVTDLTNKYAEDLLNKRDTEAAKTKKRLDNLRDKAKVTEGDV